jgi:hypothetical protein
LISEIQWLLDVVNDTHQDELTKLPALGSRTHGVADRALDRRENNLTHRSLAISRPIEYVHNARIDGLELTMFDQRSHSLFAEFVP